jgi:hypothetical protein
MGRRDLFSLLGAAVAGPLAVRAQQHRLKGICSNFSGVHSISWEEARSY